MFEYQGSAAHPREYPVWDLPEIAIVGRSNAGKSSLLNCLAGRHDLARVSKTPGRTQRLHFFAERSASLAIVDLPGYGFARVSKPQRARLAVAVERYLRERTLLRGLLLILDVRRAPQEDEEMLAEFGASRGIGLVCVATKVDKLGHGERIRRLRDLERGALGRWLPFSAVSGEGREALAQAIVLLARGQMEKGGKV